MFKSKKQAAAKAKPTERSSASTISTERIRSPQAWSSIPIEQRRPPERNVGIDRLLAVYDEYPDVVRQLDITNESLQHAENALEDAHAVRDDLRVELEHEKEAREGDRIQALKDKAEAERLTEKRVRAELDPKIAELEKKLASMTTSKKELEVELKQTRTEMGNWISSLEKLHKESASQAEKEIEAIEKRKKTLAESRTLNEEILEGLRKASTIRKQEKSTPVVENHHVTETKADDIGKTKV